jgi:hypothetical protein
MTLIVARFCAFLLKWINIGFNCLITKLQSVQTLHAIVRKVSLTSVFLTFFVLRPKKNIFQKVVVDKIALTVCVYYQVCRVHLLYYLCILDYKQFNETIYLFQLYKCTVIITK